MAALLSRDKSRCVRWTDFLNENYFIQLFIHTLWNTARMNTHCYAPACTWQCHSSENQLLTSHQRGLVSVPGQCTWATWWTKWLSNSFLLWVFHLSPVNYHSTSSSYSCIYHLGLVQLDHNGPQCQVTHPVSNHPTHKTVSMKNINIGHTFNPLTTAYKLYEDWQKHTNPYPLFVKLKTLKFHNVNFWVARPCSLVGKYATLHRNMPTPSSGRKLVQ